MKKTWAEKMADKKNFPKILNLEAKFPCYKSLVKMGARVGDRVVLANPSEVREIMAGVRRGELITIREICLRLAREHGVDACCTLTTGIFIITAAHAAAEAQAAGAPLTFPYWRTLKVDGVLNEKFPGGIEAQKKLLVAEGHLVVGKSRKLRVADYQQFLGKI